MDSYSFDSTSILATLGYEIFHYKYMLATAFKLIAKKTRDLTTQKLMQEIGSKEELDYKGWGNILSELAASELVAPNPSLSIQVRAMMAILGNRGFLEWAIVAQDENVEKLSVYLAGLGDRDLVNNWIRTTADERLHINWMKKDILGMESWEMGSGGGVRDLVFGANDGLVSILALVAGVFGAVATSDAILIAGVAGAIAGTVSMGAGAYVSSKSEQEVTRKEQVRKGIRKKLEPEDEISELISFYQEQGFERTTAENIARRVSVRLQTSEELTIGEETGLTTDEDWPPVKAGLLTGLSFLVASLVPILPFIFLEVRPAAVTALIGSVLFLFLIGASKSIFTRQSWVRSGLEVMLIGTLAAVVTFVIGLLFPE